MELKIVHYVSDEDCQIVATRRFVDDEEVSGEDFTDILVGCIEASEDEDFEDYDACEDCGEDDCEGCDLCEDEIDEFEYDADDPNDSDKAELEMLLNWAERIEENDLCFGCIFNTIADAFYAGKTIGMRESKLEIIEQLSDEVEDLDE